MLPRHVKLYMPSSVWALHHPLASTNSSIGWDAPLPAINQNYRHHHHLNSSPPFLMAHFSRGSWVLCVIQCEFYQRPPSFPCLTTTWLQLCSCSHLNITAFSLGPHSSQPICSWGVCLCLFVCLCAHLHVWGGTHVLACLWRSEVDMSI